MHKDNNHPHKRKSLTQNIKKHTFSQVETALDQASAVNLKSVINGTGIILHTGLGRAPISQKLLRRAIDNIYPYTNLEIDLIQRRIAVGQKLVDFEKKL